MNPVALLDRKRQGAALEPDEIQALVDGYVAGRVPDYQMAAFTMAACCRGLDPRETAALTKSMLASGATLSWRPGPPVVDKHSTGGIGDKSSLVLAPLLAVCGCRVPMISGRGLGTTGGTLDKLEAIPGFRTRLSLGELTRQVDELGVAMIGQTAEICPADRKLYALRDATGTVPSVGLITASILSKKAAEGLQALVLDVKHGSGAFMKTLPEAQALAESMRRVASELNLPATAVLTDMNQPTGRAVGHALEVDEAIAVLQGDGHADLVELCLTLAEETLVLAGLAPNELAARKALAPALAKGHAYEKFAALAKAQGGDLEKPRPLAPVRDWLAPHAGYLRGIDGGKIGYALIELGGGRKQVEDAIDPSVGFVFQARLGDRIEAGQPLLKVHAHDRGWQSAAKLLGEAFGIGPEPFAPPPLIVSRG